MAVWGAMGSAFADAYDDVDRLMQAGRLDDAMKTAEQFLKEQPRDPQMRFLKGVIQIDSGKRTDAIATFTQLTQDAPELPEPYNNLAVLYAGQSEFDKARSVLERAIRTNPSYATAHENLGDVYARLASQAYSKALQLDQGNTAVQPKLAVIRTLFAPSTAVASASPAAAPSTARTMAAPPPPVAAAAQAPAAPPAAPPAPATAPAPPAIVAKAPATAPAAPAAPAAAAAPDAASADVESAVRAWAAAWSAQDMDAYLAAYSPQFTPAGGQDRQAWEKERQARIVGKTAITVSVNNLAVSVNGDTATAKFRQAYRADTLNITSRKTLELQRANGQWLIRKETVGG